VKKQKELRYVKALPKSDVGPLTPFRFDVLAQLANIATRISLYEVLRLSKPTRDALRETLADAKIFVTQIPATCEEKNDSHCHHISKQFFSSPLPQKTCKLKENMTNPHITQGISDQLK